MKKQRMRFGVIILLAMSFLFHGCLKPSDPKLVSAGIGVSDLEHSLEFYTQTMGMQVKYSLRTSVMNQVILEYEDGKGSDVILMHYTDGSNPNYLYNPDKLVFYVPDAAAYADAISAAGCRIVSYPAPQPGLGNVIVGMAMDPDGYLIELIQEDGLLSPYMGAVGIGVSDLEGSADFYKEVMGMTEMYRLTVPHFMDEIILQYPYEGGGSAVVLMHYMTPRNYTDLPVKLGFCVSSPQETIHTIEDEGLEILVEPKRRPRFNPMAYGLAKDPDGYLLEIMQSSELKKERR